MVHQLYLYYDLIQQEYKGTFQNCVKLIPFSKAVILKWTMLAIWGVKLGKGV